MNLKKLIALPFALAVAFPVNITGAALTVGGIAAITSMSGCTSRSDVRTEQRVESRTEDRIEDRRD